MDGQQRIWSARGTAIPPVWAPARGTEGVNHSMLLFQLVHLVSRHQEYGGERLKITNLPMFLKKKKIKNVLMCSAGCSCCYETKHFPSTAISLGARAAMLFITVRVVIKNGTEKSAKF